ncbi:MAG: hypothetical protein NC938_00765 [Candidatus Omnitrophica bacterium]|nr:hypothetical protein [Candidatus Omnitrophota bacterium]
MRPLRASLIIGITIVLLVLGEGTGFGASVYEDSSLVSYWQFDSANPLGPTGDSKDSNSLTVDATLTTSGKVGTAYAFNGTNSDIQVGNKSNLTFNYNNAFSIGGVV